MIPTYNRCALVARAVESALAQTHPAREILVVDDGSKDETRAVVSAFGPPVRYVHQENAGCSAARNRGISAAQTDWIALLDSDDVWTSGHLAAMAQAIAATGGSARYYFADTRRAEREGKRSLWDMAGFSIEGPHEQVMDGADWALMRRQPMMLQASVFSRTALLAAGGFRTNLIRRSDTHMFLLLGIGHPICAVAGTGAHMSDDDVSKNRLTTGHPEGGRVFFDSTEEMYSELLDSPGVSASPACRAELRRRLAYAHWRLFKIDLADRQLGSAAAHLAAFLRTSPAAFLRKVTGAGRQPALSQTRPSS